MRLTWEDKAECPEQMCAWAGALHAALQYMEEPYTYHQIMGMSGACYRICFVDCWDYSCTDALVTFNTINAFGVSTPELRKEQICHLENALILEKENCRLAELILEMPEM